MAKFLALGSFWPAFYSLRPAARKRVLQITNQLRSGVFVGGSVSLVIGKAFLVDDRGASERVRTGSPSMKVT